MSDPKDLTEEEQLEAALVATPGASPAADAQAPAGGEDPAPDPQAPPDPGGDPAADPEVETKAVKAEPAKRAPRTQAQKDKRKADTARRREAIAAAPRAPDPSEADLAEQKRKDEIRAKMQDIQDEVVDIEAALAEAKAALRDASAELYPHLLRSDHHVDAVRGYIESQKTLRKTRAASPARIKAILEAAGRSPIDQAFQVQRARGARRPTRPQVAVAATGGDAAPGTDNAAGAE